MTKKSSAAKELIAAVEQLNQPLQGSQVSFDTDEDVTRTKVYTRKPKKQKVEDNSRNVRTTYYADVKAREVVRTTHAKYADNAVPNAIKHMQTNQYGALLAEVYNETEGCILHAVIKRDIGKHEIRIIYKREE